MRRQSASAVIISRMHHRSMSVADLSHRDATHQKRSPIDQRIQIRSYRSITCVVAVTYRQTDRQTN
eukprot:scaffold130292_cov50-Attheya_sp.AAC.1